MATSIRSVREFHVANGTRWLGTGCSSEMAYVQRSFCLRLVIIIAQFSTLELKLKKNEVINKPASNCETKENSDFYIDQKAEF